MTDGHGTGCTPGPVSDVQGVDAGEGLFVRPADPSAGASAPRSGRTRHQPVSSAQLALVAAVAVVGAATAIAFSDAAPTNTAWIDALERGAAVAAVAVAASRARRWTLVLATVIATVASSWPLLVVGLLALAATVFLVEQRRRSRTVGAVIGAVAALLSLSFSVPGPTGTETLLALVALVPILGSGYRHSSRQTRRVLRLSALALAVFVVVATLLSLVAGAISARPVDSGIDLSGQAVDAARGGRGDESAALFAEANEAFTDAQGSIGAIWASGPRFVPVVGANLAAVQRSVDAGAELSAAGASLVSGAEFEQVQREDGGVDLERLGELSPRVLRASDLVGNARNGIEDSASVWNLGPLADRLDDVDQRLADTARDADNAAVAVEGLPALLGADGPRRYLFLFGNPAELRDLGGHIGNWAEVSADGGSLELVEVGGPLDLAVPEASTELEQGRPASFTSMDPARSPQNLGATPDLEVAADYAAELYERRFGTSIDGVVYADVEAFAALLELVGPVDVPGLPGTSISADNAVRFLTLDQYVAFPDDEAAGDALESIIRTVFERLTTTKLAGPDRLGELFAPLVRSGRFQMASLHDSDQPMLRYFDLDGSVPEPSGGDILGVFNRNAGPSKIDSFLRRAVDVEIDWDPLTGQTRSAVVVELTNEAPPGGINETIGGSKARVEPGTNVTDVVVLSPFTIQRVFVDGVEHASRPLLEGDLWRHTVRVAIPAGETVTVRFDLEGRVDPGPRYELAYVGQPLMDDEPVAISLESTVGDVAAVEVVGAERTGSSAEIPQDNDARVRWMLDAG